MMVGFTSGRSPRVYLPQLMRTVPTPVICNKVGDRPRGISFIVDRPSWTRLSNYVTTNRPRPMETIYIKLSYPKKSPQSKNPLSPGLPRSAELPHLDVVARSHNSHQRSVCTGRFQKREQKRTS